MVDPGYSPRLVSVLTRIRRSLLDARTEYEARGAAESARKISAVLDRPPYSLPEVVAGCDEPRRAAREPGVSTPTLQDRIRGTV